MSLKQDFFTAMNAQPLFAMNNTRVGMDDSVFDSKRGPANLYFGTGLTSRAEISAGLPFDFLGMMLPAELLRRKLGLGKVIQEISDTHAYLVNQNVDPRVVSEKARTQKALIDRIAKRLGMQDTYEVVCASSYQTTQEYQAITKELREVVAGTKDAGLSPQFSAEIGENPYFRMQWAGMAYLRRQQNVQVKLSWLIEDDSKIKGYDERAFDRGFLSLGRDSMSFAYVYSGLTFDSASNFRVIPYTAKSGEQRLMLQDGESAERLLEFLPPQWPKNQAPKGKQYVLNRMQNILTLAEELFPGIGIPKGTLFDQVNFVLQDVCGLKPVGEMPKPVVRSETVARAVVLSGGGNER